MLSNMETMTVERIYSMLRMMVSFSSSGSSGEFRLDMNVVQLRRYLQTLVDSDILELAGESNYRLRKS